MRGRRRPYLSLIIPIHNNSLIFPQIVLNIDKSLENFKKRWEILIIDYGSKDNGPEISRKMARVIPNLKIIENKIELNQGEILRQGMIVAGGQKIILGFTPIHFLYFESIINSIKKKEFASSDKEIVFYCCYPPPRLRYFFQFALNGLLRKAASFLISFVNKKVGRDFEMWDLILLDEAIAREIGEAINTRDNPFEVEFMRQIIKKDYKINKESIRLEDYNFYLWKAKMSSYLHILRKIVKVLR